MACTDSGLLSGPVRRIGDTQFTQVGWHGASGEFWCMGCDPRADEPDGFWPMYVARVIPTDDDVDGIPV